MKEPETIARRIGRTATGWGLLVAGALFGAATMAAVPEDPFADRPGDDQATRVEPGVIVDPPERQAGVRVEGEIRDRFGVPPESVDSVEVPDPPAPRARN